MYDFDEAYRHGGELGRAQLSRYILLALGIMCGSMQILQLSFTAAKPQASCFVPQTVSYSSTECEYCSIQENDTCHKCSSWVYDDEFYGHTAITEFDLVCDRQYLNTLTSSILWGGMLAGSIFFGRISDAIGRRRTQALIALCAGIISVCKAVIPGLAGHILLAFLCGCVGISIHIIAHVIVMETVGKTYRIIIAMMNQVMWAIGETILGIIAYYVRDWRRLQLYISLPFFLLAPAYLFFLFESPRWLLGKGELQESAETLKKMAQINGKTIPTNVLPNPENTITTEDDRNQSILEALRRHGLRSITLVIFYNWFVNALLFYGMAMNISNMKGINPYILYFITMLAEIPGVLAALYLLNKIGRKPLQVILYAVGGLMCFLCGGVYEVNLTASVILSVIGKACVAGNFGIAYIYAVEVYPTCIRGAAIGAASMMARPGAIIAPFVAALGGIRLIIPLAIFGACGLLAALLSQLVLPETMGRPLPQNLREAEDLYTVRIEPDVPESFQHPDEITYI